MNKLDTEIELLMKKRYAVTCHIARLDPITDKKKLIDMNNELVKLTEELSEYECEDIDTNY